MRDGTGHAGLQYRGEERVRVGARRVVEVPASRHGRLVWSGGGLDLMGEGLRGRWVCRLGLAEMLLICPGERVRVRSAGDHGCELRLVEFAVHGAGLRQWMYGTGAPVAVRVPGAARMLDALSGAEPAPGWAQPASAAALGEADLAEAAAHFRAQALLYELMAAYLSGVRAQRAASPLLAYAEQVRSQMAARCEQEYNVEEIARGSGVSPHRFYQVFREMTGLTPHKYLTALRLRRALRLLAGEYRSVADVAHAVGYQDELYFSRVFKRELGVAPSAFAQLARTLDVAGVSDGDLAIFGLAARPGPAGTRQGGGVKQADVSEGDLTWRQRVERLGRRLGLEGVAVHWLGLMERRLCHLRGLVRSRLGEAPLIVAAVEEEGLLVFGGRHPGLGDLLYGSAGFTPSAAVRGLRETRLASPGDLAALGCRWALFLLREGRRAGDAEEAWLATTGGEPGVQFLTVPWTGGDDADACERLVEQLTLRLLAQEAADHTRQQGCSIRI